MDDQLNLLESELRLAHSRLFDCELTSSEWSHDEVRHTQRALREFLRKNVTLLQLAADTYAQLAPDKRRELCQQYNLTASIVVLENAEDFIYRALDTARNETWETNVEQLLSYEASQIEVLPRVLSYAKYVAHSGNDRVQGTPLLRYLPQHLRKVACLQQHGDKTTIRISVYGGLSEDNRAVIESIRFPPDLGLARTAEAAAVAGSVAPAVDAPFHTVVSCDKVSAEAALRTLSAYGFRIERD